MSLPSLLPTRAWIAVPLLALAFLVWSHGAQHSRIAYVTQVVPGEAVASAVSPTGYAGGIRNLILVGPDHGGAHWIAQTQQMLAGGESRARSIDYENAPFGRDLTFASPYRWWLGLMAWLDHAATGRPLGQSVEKAALLADPSWHLFWFVAAVAFTAWRFGILAAALLSVGLVALFPFATGFHPGNPDDGNLARSCTFASLSLLLAGIHAARRSSGWFFAAGVLGGIGLWLRVAEMFPVIIGTTAGALCAAWLVRREPASADAGALPLPDHWLAWTLGGTAASLACYLVEYAPDHLGGWQLRSLHPLYSVAWLGLGLVIFQVTQRWHGETSPGKLPRVLVGILALAALAALPVAMSLTSNPAFLAIDLGSYRLTKLADSPEATSLGAWLSRDGGSAQVWSTLLPVLLVLPAGWLLWHRKTELRTRFALAVVMGPLTVVLALAFWQLDHWAGCDTLLLALLVTVTAYWGRHRRTAVPWTGIVLLLLAPGFFQLWPSSKSPEEVPLNDAEVSGLISRDLAHWLAKHAAPGGATVLAPPHETTALYYYGGLPGIATLSLDNQAGLAAAVRIFSASSPQEALALLNNRQVTHIVIPSWDRLLDEYVRLGGGRPGQTFLDGLRDWTLPPWLRPVAYQLPHVAGYEDQSVAVFAVVEEQTEALSLSRLLEYFIETGRMEYASQVGQALQRFPADLGAVVARAQLAMIRRDESGLHEALQGIIPKLNAGADRWLPFDRRMALGVVLAQGQHADLAREQVKKCLGEANEMRLRTAPTTSLYRLMVLAKRFGLEINDPQLQATVRELLPAENLGPP